MQPFQSYGRGPPMGTPDLSRGRPSLMSTPAGYSHQMARPTPDPNPMGQGLSTPARFSQSQVHPRAPMSAPGRTGGRHPQHSLVAGYFPMTMAHPRSNPRILGARHHPYPGFHSGYPPRHPAVSMFPVPYPSGGSAARRQSSANEAQPITSPHTAPQPSPHLQRRQTLPTNSPVPPSPRSMAVQYPRAASLQGIPKSDNRYSSPSVEATTRSSSPSSALGDAEDAKKDALSTGRMQPPTIPVGKENPSASAEKSPKKPKKDACGCKKNRCLTKYCICFAAELFCDGCKCGNQCQNVAQNVDTVARARTHLLAKNRSAFDKEKIAAQGCTCKQSKCLKKYCPVSSEVFDLFALVRSPYTHAHVSLEKNVDRS
jgi:Tesmin/TSO1-like CXC domain, cysteine-rich domain